MDEVFKHSRDFFDGQLKALNDTIFQNKRDLFYKRKFELQNLAEVQRQDDLAAMQFLLKLTVATKDELTERREKLVEICLKNNINHPMIGEERYDPRKFDYSRIPPNFGHKIKALCTADTSTYYKYKQDSHEILDIKVGHSPEELQERQR